MQFVQSRKRKSIRLTGERKEGYFHPLSFYITPPTDTISLHEFESYALERLQVLRSVERCGQKYLKTTSDYREALKQELKNQNLQAYYKTSVAEEDITDKIYDEYRKDCISHFILQLSYCRTEELRRWFIAQELDLFRFRFTSERHSGVKKFLEISKLNYVPITPHERSDLMKKLIDSSYCMTATKVEDSTFYKIYFTKVLDLVKARKVYIKRGYAYIHSDDLVFVVLSIYRSHLSHALAVTSRAFPQLEDDGRLLNIVSSLNRRYVGKDYSNVTKNEVSPEMIDSLAKTAFPPCMQSLHETLRQTHHLKHGGRLQYGLFLKAIGLSLEDALRFWREEFTKIVESDKFDKEYSYNIRHNYGKEGKKANYTPYSCMKIILSSTPGPGDSHGCPFKHSDLRLLQQKFQSLGLEKSGIKDIADFVNKGHYQLACTRYFELTHNEATVDQAINHPNQYFEESQKIEKGVVNSSRRSIPNKTTVLVPSISKVESNEFQTPEDYNIDDLLPSDIELMLEDVDME